jgi:hypothetical protein
MAQLRIAGQAVAIQNSKYLPKKPEKKSEKKKNCPTSAVNRHTPEKQRVRGRTGRIYPACNIVRVSKHPRHALGKA